MRQKDYILTKSKYIRGLQCQRAMYYDVYCPKKAIYPKETIERFREGRDFEAKYKARYDDGIALDGLLGYRYDSYPQRTAELLSQTGEVVLFEAGFIYDGVLVLLDVLRKNNNGSYDIFEVKNNNRLKEVFRNDAAVQYYVVSHLLNNIRTFNIVNNDGNDSFVITDILQSCKDEMATVTANVKSFKAVLETSVPDIMPGDHCHKPYDCPYAEHCRSEHSKLSWLPM